MTCYRIKHKPSGLYYCPSRKVQVRYGDRTYYTKSNLSKNGKIYSKRPTLKWVGGSYYTHLLPDVVAKKRDVLLPVSETEWAIEEV